jgi:hypothetical protein
MDEMIRGMSETRLSLDDTWQQPGASERPEGCGGDPLAKGAMREPAQTPEEEHSPTRELQDALEELEKEKGDWSKGG